MENEIDLSMPAIPLATAVPMPMPMAPPTVLQTPLTPHGTNNDSPQLRKDQIETLRQQGFPLGLAHELGKTRAAYPLRFWVVDNSGSMQMNDGHQLRCSASAAIIQVVPCTRWIELQGSLDYHIQLAGLLEATTMFRMLNDPGRGAGSQSFTVGQPGAELSIMEQVLTAQEIVRKSSPRGVTPLTQHLKEIRAQLVAVEGSLRAKGQEAVVVLATDGLPSNAYGESSESVLRDFLIALKALQSLPVWIVIRLCTDDTQVVNYYNSLDNELELPLEVIDDFFGEGVEITSANKWLTYGLPLHRCREMGYHHRVFDLLDERQLNKDELVEFLSLLLGHHDWPDPHAEWKDFVKVLQQVLDKEEKLFSPRTRKLESWIDIKQLKKAYGSGFRLFGRKN